LASKQSQIRPVNAKMLKYAISRITEGSRDRAGRLLDWIISHGDKKSILDGIESLIHAAGHDALELRYTVLNLCNTLNSIAADLLESRHDALLPEIESLVATVKSELKTPDDGTLHTLHGSLKSTSGSSRLSLDSITAANSEIQRITRRDRSEIKTVNSRRPA